MPTPTGELLGQLDFLCCGMRIAMSTIRKMKHEQKVDADAALPPLELIRAEAKEVSTQC